jgi:cytochrome P450
MSTCPFHHDAPSGSDPFKAEREKNGVLHTEFQGRAVPMILTHGGVVAAAKDWQTFSSDAPVRLPIPSEEDVRTVRQYPLEVDPPEHTDYRKLIEPFFNRPKDPQMVAAVGSLIDRLIDETLAEPGSEIVHDFAIPLQSRALAILVNAPEGDADVWISWGTHVFRDKEGKSKGFFLEHYCATLLDRALENPRDDLFTALTKMEIQGRPLTRDEQLGFLSIVFAGGRDTVIHTITGIIGFFAQHPEALHGLRERPDLTNLASEEFFRVLSPITHIGRVLPKPTEVGGRTYDANERVSLCWASANRDGSVFPDPDMIKLDRKPNPHIAFGRGTHLCLGALHARLLARTLIEKLASRVERIEIGSEKPHAEREPGYERIHGYDLLSVRFQPRAPSPAAASPTASQSAAP